MKNAMYIIGCILLTLCFSILFLCTLMQLEEADKQFTRAFAMFFVGACLFFVAYLRLDNNKK
jgi:hypothetical protein